jgi:hypothetical protein
LPYVIPMYIYICALSMGLLTPAMVKIC